MKTFLSIGSGPGNGLATAQRFAREGFAVVLSARQGDKVEALAKHLRDEGHKVETRAVDVGDPASVAALVTDVETSLGGIDVLHFNAAAMRKANLAEQPRDTFNTDLAVNIGGAMVALQAAAAKMFERGSGTVLLTGGGFGVQPHPDYLSLSIGKAGIRALAQGVFENFKERNVHVATVTIAGFVSPGAQAEAVADHFWRLHDQPREAWAVESVYTPES